ncbi:MAG TPA: AAA family ATPase [Dehalococcoidia bacterium]|nr:AAA family ATPase [Dehalococcoidia bacterium]HIK89763.1 AAA family ATPase [Dehalococcoidia bacterium]
MRPTPIYSLRASILTDSTTPTTNRPAVVGWTTFGHPGATRLLSKSYETGRLAHAYLITGPDKVGKRTLAIDIACMVNSEPVIDMFGEADNMDLSTSQQAERIRKGIHSDVRMIDPNTELDKDSRKTTNSNGGDGDGDDAPARGRQTISIEHIRDLIKDSATTPFEGAKKVFIIDGAHRMVEAAFNAMLKTLEEPSDDVLIILTAPTDELLPETVVSRCQRIDLRPVDADVIKTELIEKLEAEESQAHTLSRLARGCPGWAIDALNDPTIIDAHNQAILRFAEIITGNVEERLRYARQTGGQFWRDRDAVLAEMQRWLEWWRDVAMLRHKLEDQVTNTEWVELLSEIASQLKVDQIAGAVTSIQNALTALEANAVPQLTLEVLMLDLPWADPAKVPSLSFDEE